MWSQGASTNLWCTFFIHSYGFWLSSPDDHWKELVFKVIWLWSKWTNIFLWVNLKNSCQI